MSFNYETSLTCCCDGESLAVARGVVKVILSCMRTALSRWSTCGTRAGIYLVWELDTVDIGIGTKWNGIETWGC